MNKKIAMVCQRYGLEVNGGAELYCRQIAEKLSSHYDVTVYTTCAVDYSTWKNVYPEGETTINDVLVKRFKVNYPRNPKLFAAAHNWTMGHPEHSDRMEELWLKLQGPVSTALERALDQEKNQYQKIIFMTYLYYPTVNGLRKGYDNVLLIPTVHDEPPVYLRVYDKVFAKAQGIIWNTVEEKEFGLKRFPDIKNTPSVITGIGIEGAAKELPSLPKELQEEQFLMYAGRIVGEKGCDEMLDFFQKYKERNKNSKLKLALIGKTDLTIPQREDIIHLGFVSDEMKFGLLKNALALVLHSRFESLSMVVLESMYMARPVLVSSHCEVLKGHCIRSNAGFHFENYEEYEAELNYLQEHHDQYEQMRKNAVAYVRDNYQWDVIINKYIQMIEM